MLKVIMYKFSVPAHQLMFMFMDQITDRNRVTSRGGVNIMAKGEKEKRGDIPLSML